MTVDRGGGPTWTGKVQLDEDALEIPFRRSQPATISVCSTSDLFYEAIPDAWINRVLSVIDAAPQHKFQILTKRAARAREVLTGQPLPQNVSLGTSAERQQEAQERIPDLLATPAGARFVMFYPLIGPIDLMPILRRAGYRRGSIGFAGIGGEPERPFDTDWLASLNADLTALGVPVARVKPDPWAFAKPGQLPDSVSALAAIR